MSGFVFGRDLATFVDADTLLLRVPSGITEKSKLLHWLAEELDFPSYFGGNWDALEECLRDLDWITHRRVVVVHRDIPFAGNHKDQQMYFEVLRETVRYWQSDPAHDVVVVFDPDAEPIVASALTS